MKPLLIILTGFLALTQAEQALAQNAPPPPPRTITVTGESKQDVSPDQAILSMSLVSKDKELATAKQHNDSLVDKVMNIAKEYTIPREKIATSSLYISPEYTYNSTSNQQVFVGYSVNRSLRMTISDLSVQERLVSALVQANIDQVNGLEFQLSDPDKISSKLRVKAYENAKSKAEALAQAAGAKLGQPLTIMTGDFQQPPFPRPPVPMLARAMSTAGASESAPVLPGLINVEQSVTVTFALE